MLRKNQAIRIGFRHNNCENEKLLFSRQEVLEEIFAAPQKELRDEVNIELEAQEEPKLLVIKFLTKFGN
jgi:hypothetical protein